MDEGSAKIPLAGEEGMCAVVDAADLKRASIFEWRLSAKGEPKASYPDPDHPTVYTSVTLKALILGVRTKGNRCIKNLDGDPLNCRRANLREMSVAEARALDKKVLGPQIRAPKKVKKDIRRILGTLKPPRPEPLFHRRSDDIQRRLLQASVDVLITERLKSEASASKRSVSDLVEEALREWLAKRP